MADPRELGAELRFTSYLAKREGAVNNIQEFAAFELSHVLPALSDNKPIYRTQSQRFFSCGEGMR